MTFAESNVKILRIYGMSLMTAEEQEEYQARVHPKFLPSDDFSLVSQHLAMIFDPELDKPTLSADAFEIHLKNRFDGIELIKVTRPENPTLPFQLEVHIRTDDGLQQISVETLSISLNHEHLGQQATFNTPLRDIFVDRY